MFGVICLETGEMTAPDVSCGPDDTESAKFGVLTRLHARACLIFGEIVCLLKGGYADGALARWRALHEVSAIALFIAERPADLSIRFLEHRHVECWRKMKKYQEHCERLGSPPCTEDEMRCAEGIAVSLISSYGKSFEWDYGWAAHELKTDRPSFPKIEEAVGIHHLRPYYQWACEKVHASCNGLYSTLGLLEDEDVMLAGPSDAGLADPAQLAAIALLQTTAAFQSNYPDMDNLVAVHIAHEVSTEIGNVFGQIQKSWEEEQQTTQGNGPTNDTGE
jgi:hypothetical protein